MGNVDSRAKEYFSDNERFADLCNYVLYDGEPVIQPDFLEEKDTTEVLSVFGADQKQIHIQKWRDLLRSTVIRSFQGVCLILIGVEAQADIHYAMPVKNMIYDALNYGYQVKEAARKHKQDRDYKDSAEFLSGFRASDKLTPIITITVYLGTEDWDAPRKLSDMYGEVDERLRPFLQDFNANVLVPREMHAFSKFRTGLKQVFEVLNVAGDRDAMEKVFRSDKMFQALDNETVHAINEFAGTRIPVNKKGKVTDVCKAWEDQEQYGRSKERIDAIRNMIELGLTKEQILKKYSEEEYEKAEQELLVHA